MGEARSKKSRGALIGLVIGVAVIVLVVVVVGISLTSDGDSPESPEDSPREDAAATSDTDAGTGCDFTRPPKHAAAEDPCSPSIGFDDFDWRGIEINMPARVELPGDEHPGLNPYESRVPMSILLQTTALRAARYPLEMEGIAILFVDRASGATFTSHLGETGISPEGPGGDVETDELSAEELADRVARFYYNINALDFVQLPNAPATYDVHATFEDHSSRVMTISLE